MPVGIGFFQFIDRIRLVENFAGQRNRHLHHEERRDGEIQGLADGLERIQRYIVYYDVYRCGPIGIIIVRRSILLIMFV